MRVVSDVTNRFGEGFRQRSRHDADQAKLTWHAAEF